MITSWKVQGQWKSGRSTDMHTFFTKRQVDQEVKFLKSIPAIEKVWVWKQLTTTKLVKKWNRG